MNDSIYALSMDTVRMESRTAEYRKVVKPLLEKRRRARMNSSLNELKAFIVDAKKAEISDPSKLEKADILELTVRHLRELRRQQRALSSAMTVGVEASRFCAGFLECAQEVGVYVAALPGIDGGLKSRLLAHLSRCMSQADRLHPSNQPIRPAATTTTPGVGVPAPVPLHPATTAVPFPALAPTYSSPYPWNSSVECSSPSHLTTGLSFNEIVTHNEQVNEVSMPLTKRELTVGIDDPSLMNFNQKDATQKTRSTSPVWRPW